MMSKGHRPVIMHYRVSMTTGSITSKTGSDRQDRQYKTSSNRQDRARQGKPSKTQGREVWVARFPDRSFVPSWGRPRY